MADERSGEVTRPDPGGPVQVTEELGSPFLDDDEHARTAVAAQPVTRPTSPVIAPGAASSSAAVAPPAPPDPDDGPIRHARDDDDRRPGFVARLGGVAIAVTIGIAGAALLLTWLLGRTVSALNPFEERTVDRSGPAVITQLNDLKQFQAASGYYEIVIDQEKDVKNLPAFLAGERVVFVAAGSVDAIVDFSGLGPNSVTVDQARTTATIRLPSPEVGKPRLDLQRSYVAGHQRGALERLQDLVDNQGGGTNTEELYRLAEQRLGAARTRTDELKARAKANTRAMLTSLLTSVGFRTVTVTFVDEP